jgi:exodeoxyribonuclease VII small subunit
VDFEASLARLQELVQRLEDGEVSLEESVQAYAEGVELARRCFTRLRDAEETIQRLTETQQGFQLEDDDLEDEG